MTPESLDGVNPREYVQWERRILKKLVIPRHQSPMELEPFAVRKKRFDLKKGPEKVLEDAPGGMR